jgi:hypothetical protein
MLIIGCDFHPGFQQVAIFAGGGILTFWSIYAPVGVKIPALSCQRKRRDEDGAPIRVDSF